MRDYHEYEVVVVGGGPAGLTTALYTTRLGHETAVIETAGGRHMAVRHVHNLLGISEDVSGSELAEHGIRQLEEYGADFYPDAVTDVEHENDGFRLEATHATVRADRLVLATGFTDVSPDVRGLERFTGRGLHYCLHCDAYTLGDGDVFVLGHSDHAAEVAMLLLNFTDRVDLLLDGHEPDWSDETPDRLRVHPVDRIDTDVAEAFPEDGESELWLGGLAFADGTEREYTGGFAVYGKEYNAELAEQLGCDRDDEGAVAVDDRGRTSVDGVYAVGDVAHGQNQTPIALGDGARAGIALHKDLRTFPLDSEKADGEPSVDDDDVPGSSARLRARMRRDRHRGVHQGLREPTPDR